MRRARIRVAMVAVSVASFFAIRGASAEDMVDVVPSLFGGDGIQLFQVALTNLPADDQSFAQFGLSSIDEFSALSGALASTLTQFGSASGTTSFTFDVQQAVFVRTTESLGPLFADRSNTVGKNKLNVAFSFFRQDFQEFKGEDLSNLQFRLRQLDLCADGAGVNGRDCDEPRNAGPEFEPEDLLLDLDLELAQNLYSFFFTYGITSRWDVGLVVPLVQTHFEASARATLLGNGGVDPTLNYFCPPAQPSCLISVDSSLVADRGTGDPRLPKQATSEADEDDFGFGDIILRTKYNFMRDHASIPDMAAIGAVTFETGDEDNFRGTGTTQLLAGFIASKTYFGWLTPHLNTALQFATSNNDLNNARYIVGADAQVSKGITLSLDFLGRSAFSDDTIGNHLFDIGLGAKVSPIESFNVFAGGLFPLNQGSGLRPDVGWTVGVEYTF